MRTRHVYFAFCILLSVGLSSRGQVQAPVQGSDPVVAANDAHGGAVIATVRTVRVTGQSTWLGNKQPVTISATLDGQVRFDYGPPLNRSIVVGVGSYEVVDGKTIPKPPHSGLFAPLDALSILGTQQYLVSTATRNPAGTVAIGNEAALQYQVTTTREMTEYARKLQDVAQVYVAQSNGLVVGISRQMYADESLDHIFAEQYQFGDFRTVNGLVFPFRIDKYINGILRESITVASVELNPSLPSDLFTR